LSRIATLLLLAAGVLEAAPNVVVFLVDDLGWKDLGCQGSPVFETPHADGLAREGVRLTQAYAACPVCSPSRAALLTGRTPARVGVTGHITAVMRHRYPENGRIIPPDDRMFLALEERTLAEALGEAGYATASIGKWHLGSESYWPEKQGFGLNVAGHTHGSPSSYWFPYRNPALPWNPRVENLEGGRPGEYLTDRLTEEAVAFIRANRKKPFLLYLSHYAVHTPLQAPAELTAKYRRKPATALEGVDPVYAAMVEKTDNSLGRVLTALEELGLGENTLVIFTSDNGGLLEATTNRPLRAGKGFLYEGGVRVPLLLRWPGNLPAGVESQALAIGHDLYPTILAAAGAAPPADRVLDGKNLLPWLTGDPAAPAERELFWYYPHYSPQARQPGAALRRGRWKLIEHYDPPLVELFDLDADPGETSNVAAVHTTRRDAMLERLRVLIADSGAISHRPNPAHAPAPR
jgi:arylsulfatase A